MSVPASVSEHILFAGGPPYGLATRLRLIRAADPRIARQALLAALVGWLPLALLTLMHGDFLRPDHAGAFALDFGAYSRFLIAAPLLILAEPLCAPRLAAIARQFLASGLIADSDRTAYERAITSSRRFMSSPSAEIGTLLLAYALALALVLLTPVAVAPAWIGQRIGHTVSPSPAGWWSLLVSLPLLLMLLLGWLWRVGVWARFLWLMNRIDLRLIPSHPDHAGGLKFVGSSLRAFVPLGVAIGVIGAGAELNLVIHHDASPLAFKYLSGGLAVFVLLLCGAPLLVFSSRLYQAHHHGMFEYGALAIRMGEQFERNWVRPQARPEERAPEVSQFAATTSAYAITGHVYAMKWMPFELGELLVLAAATLLPFLPVAVLAVPFEVIVKKLLAVFI